MPLRILDAELLVDIDGKEYRVRFTEDQVTVTDEFSGKSKLSLADGKSCAKDVGDFFKKDRGGMVAGLLKQMGL